MARAGSRLHEDARGAIRSDLRLFPAFRLRIPTAASTACFREALSPAILDAERHGAAREIASPADLWRGAAQHPSVLPATPSVGCGSRSGKPVDRSANDGSAPCRHADLPAVMAEQMGADLWSRALLQGRESSSASTSIHLSWQDMRPDNSSVSCSIQCHACARCCRHSPDNARNSPRVVSCCVAWADQDHHSESGPSGAPAAAPMC